jgi:hypothetical protein
MQPQTHSDIYVASLSKRSEKTYFVDGFGDEELQSFSYTPRILFEEDAFVKMRGGWGVAGLLMILVLSGCGKGSPIVSTVLADVAPGFTPPSHVTAIDDNTYYIGVEAVLPPGFSRWVLPFQLPPGRIVQSVQGTISHRAGCYSQALGSVTVDGKIMPIIIKLPNGGGASTVFVNYSTPVQYTNGDAGIWVEADPSPGCPGTTTWEFQGVLRIE